MGRIVRAEESRAEMVWIEMTRNPRKKACVQGSTNGTNGVPLSFKVLQMVPMVPLGEPRTEPRLRDR